MKTIIKKCAVTMIALVSVSVTISWGQTPLPTDLITIEQLVPLVPDSFQDLFNTPANCRPSSITDPSFFVEYDNTMTSASRTLSREDYPDTTVKAQKPDSQQWVTKCPVQIDPAQIQSSKCIPSQIFNYGELFITNSGTDLIFKIDTTKGTFFGNLIRVSNPHGSNTHAFNRHINPEIAWLRSTNAVLVGSNSNQITHEFYIFLQKRAGKKYYLVEAFDLTDTPCLTAHRPNQSTLCINDYNVSAPNCVLPRALPDRPQVNWQGNNGPKYPDDTVLLSKLVNGTTVSKLPGSNHGNKEGFVIKSQDSAWKSNQSQAKSPPAEDYQYQTDSGGGHEPVEYNE